MDTRSLQFRKTWCEEFEELGRIYANGFDYNKKSFYLKYNSPLLICEMVYCSLVMGKKITPLEKMEHNEKIELWFEARSWNPVNTGQAIRICKLLVMLSYYIK